MSGFAALTGFEGDSDDVLAAHKKREADEEKARAAEVEATRARFDKLKASAGATNWADSDEDDDAFFGKPPGLGGPPGLQATGDGSDEQESSSDDDSDGDGEQGSTPSVPVSNGAVEVPAPKQRRKKPAKKDNELEEVDALLASLESADSKGKNEPAGQSKAALKRAKKKAEAANKPGAEVSAPAAEAAEAAEAESETGTDGAVAGKSPEEVKAMLAAKAAAAKKAKDKKKNSSAAAAAAAAAKAGGAGGGKTKKPKDKSHYNQMPC
mmetsp:Transcript_15783/g.47897  ORF Transcript_15783/g.47897 Transcript_15783/m.47897 type:complete len:267 (-) Transcript_15783:785-1585(-)